MNRHPLFAQRGMTLTTLVFMLIIVVLVIMLGVKVVPTVIEYRAISKAIVDARDSSSTAREIQLSFDRRADVGYIEAIKGSDLEIVKVDNKFEVSFAYDKKIPLIGPASLLIEYEGTTAKSSSRKTPPASK